MKEFWKNLSKTTRWVIIGVVVVLALAVVGNLLPEEEETTQASSEPTTSTTAEPVETTTDEPVEEVTELPLTVLEPLMANPVVTGVESVGENNWEVSTSIVDPRGDAGSTEAQEAIAVCEEAVSLAPEGAVIKVMEDDGTTFVVYGIANPMIEDTSVCSEY